MRNWAFCVLVLALVGCGPNKEEVGAFSNDLMGNQIKIDALMDPKIPNVICHMAFFERGILDRAQKGKWFEDPSNTSVSCQRIGPIDLRRVSLDDSGKEIFSEGQSLFLKKAALRRIVDLDHRSLIYVAHARELVNGSAKMSISTVLLTPEEVRDARKNDKHTLMGPQ